MWDGEIVKGWNPEWLMWETWSRPKLESGHLLGTFRTQSSTVDKPLFLNWNLAMSLFLSRTQTLITHISRLCQEIRDIKRQNKNRSNSIPKAKPREGKMLSRVQEEKAMDSNQCQDRTSIDGTDGSGCTCSSHSTPPPHSEHSHDIPSHHETSHPPLSSTPPQSNQEQPAARSSLPPVDIQLSTSSSLRNDKSYD